MPHREPSYQNQQSEEEHDQECREEEDLAKAALRRPGPSWIRNPIYIWAFQGVIAAALALMVGYITLWMDSHNDNRYVQKVDYIRDAALLSDRYRENRESDRKDRDAIRMAASQDKTDLNKRLDRQEIQLDTIAADIKNLLRQTK